MSNNKFTPYTNNTENRMIDALDELDTFHNEYMKLLPEIRAALQQNKKSKDILKAGSSLAAARLLNIALTNKDEAKALAAIKDILDRTEGKATETKEVTHRLAQLEERDLDNLLEQELLALDQLAEASEEE